MLGQSLILIFLSKKTPSFLTLVAVTTKLVAIATNVLRFILERNDKPSSNRTRFLTNKGYVDG
jgi:hypothetical protein